MYAEIHYAGAAGNTADEIALAPEKDEVDVIASGQELLSKKNAHPLYATSAEVGKKKGDCSGRISSCHFRLR
jgi:hypothetical protein